MGTGSTCPRQPVPGGWGQTAAWFPELVGARDLPGLSLPIPMGQRKWQLGQQQQDSLRLALRLEGKIRAPAEAGPSGEQTPKQPTQVLLELSTTSPPTPPSY